MHLVVLPGRAWDRPSLQRRMDSLSPRVTGRQSGMKSHICFTSGSHCFLRAVNSCRRRRVGDRQGAWLPHAGGQATAQRHILQTDVVASGKCETLRTSTGQMAEFGEQPQRDPGTRHFVTSCAFGTSSLSSVPELHV